LSGLSVGAALARRHWVNTGSRDHVLLGVADGFTQAGHGRATKLRRLARDDLVVFYSPRTALHDGQPLQCFTALGRVVDDEPYQVAMTPTFHPWRRRLAFLTSVAVPIRPLLEHLDFIADKRRWALPFRRGLFEIAKADLVLIANAMRVRL
jgi:hypothetical protein